jgi:DNA recombination-dependent growth factor C
MKTLGIFRNLSAFILSATDDEAYSDDPHRAITECEELSDVVEPYLANPPSGGQRETVGFTVVDGDENNFFMDIQGSGTLCFLTFMKRDLPARVVRDRVDEMCQEVESTMGRKPGRKERAELAEDAEHELLPKAFISKTRVPVIFTSKREVFIFTTAQKRIDACHLFLGRFLQELKVDYTPVPFGLDYQMTINAEAWINSLALGDHDGETFVATDFAAMREGASGKLRVTDRELGHQEVQNALKSGWRVEQIGMMYVESAMRFRMDTSMRFRQIKLGEDALLESSEADGEMLAVAWLILKECQQLINAIREETEDGEL